MIDLNLNNNLSCACIRDVDNANFSINNNVLLNHLECRRIEMHAYMFINEWKKNENGKKKKESVR